MAGICDGKQEKSNYGKFVGCGVGPVANDQTMQTLVLYLDGYLTAEQTIANLLPQNLKDQLVFKTEKAISALEYVEGIRI